MASGSLRLPDDRLHVLCNKETSGGVRVISLGKANQREVNRNGREITLVDNDEVPELTEEDFARMILFYQLLAEEQEFLRQIKHATIRLDPPAVEEITLKLSAPVIERLRATGAGGEDRIDHALREWLDQQKPS